jgi:hypothetical protein
MSVAVGLSDFFLENSSPAVHAVELDRQGLSVD